MLRGLFGQGRLSEGWMLFSHMEAQEVPPNQFTYNILLDGLVKSDDIDKASSFVCLMEDRGFSPDLVTYGTLVNGLCTRERFDIARNIVNQLPQKGLQSDVDIGSLCQKGLIEEVKCSLWEMDRNGCTPTSTTYILITRILLERNKLYHVVPFLEEMRSRGFNVARSFPGTREGWSSCRNDQAI